LSRFNKTLIYPLLLAVLGTFYGARVSAQDATGRITGVIYDPSGAVIADAQIIVTNIATHISRSELRIRLVSIRF
jgi:hypothetical protein